MYSEMSVAGSGTFWRSDTLPAVTLPADGCVDLMLLDDELWLAGPSTRRVDARADGAAVTYGLRFAPGSVAAPIQGDLAAVRDSRVLVHEILGSRPAKAVERAIRLLAGDHDEGRQLRTSPALAKAEAGWVSFVHTAARRQVSFAQIQQRLGWSERHVRRRMIATFGYSYPTLVRIERARFASSLIGGGTALSVTANTTGYADQAHMTREFARFIGLAPGQLAPSSA